MINTKKGFTLIELLVVVGIIGILATITIASLNSARGKARDAKRISDVKQMINILAAEDAGAPAQALATCVLANALTSTCTGPGDVMEFNKFADPTGVAACIGTSAAPCAYAISQADGGAAATTNDYRICYYLEAGGGLKSVENGGPVTDGCVD